MLTSNKKNCLKPLLATASFKPRAKRTTSTDIMAGTISVVITRCIFSPFRSLFLLQSKELLSGWLPVIFFFKLEAVIRVVQIDLYLKPKGQCVKTTSFKYFLLKKY